MKLYNYWRSSCSWRVRLALNLKGLRYEYEAVNLAKEDQVRPDFVAKNARAEVPVLELDDGTRLTQSLAILAYLDEHQPTPPLWPRDPLGRARVWQLAEMVNSGIQPLQNLVVLKYVKDTLQGDERVWLQHWIRRGMVALEREATRTAGTYLVGNTLSAADLCLLPQLYTARRYEALPECPTLLRIEAACAELEAVRRAHPDQQPDAPKS